MFNKIKTGKTLATPKKWLIVGARGRFHWHDLTAKNEAQTTSLRRDKSGTFEIIEVRSKDFIISATFDDNGETKPRVYCEKPHESKPKAYKNGSLEGIEERTMEWLPNGWVNTHVDRRTDGEIFITKLEYQFNFIPS